MPFILGHSKVFCIFFMKDKYFSVIAQRNPVCAASLFLLFSVFTSPQPHANAAEINNDGAQALKAVFQDLLDYEKTVSESFGTVNISYEGALSVEQNA